MIPKEALFLSSAGSKGARSDENPRYSTMDDGPLLRASAETSRRTMSRLAVSEIAAVSSVAGDVQELVSPDIRGMQREQPCQPQCQVCIGAICLLRMPRLHCHPINFVNLALNVIKTCEYKIRTKIWWKFMKKSERKVNNRTKEHIIVK